MRARPDGDRHRLIAAVERGASLGEAAAVAGVPIGTVHAWRSRDPAFRQRLDDARAGRRAPVLRVADRPTARPGREELLDMLGEAAREGNIRAIELLLRLTPATVADDEPSPWSGIVDEVLARRQQ